MAHAWNYYPDHWQFYHKVTFDGPNKIIWINPGVTELNVKTDLYSDWKEWTDNQNPDGLINARYLPAMRAVGGDPLPGGRSLGSTYFLTNGWKIKPYEGSYRLTVSGNLYTEDGSSPYLSADGLLNNIFIQSDVSTLVESTGVGSSAEVADAVWGTDLEDYESQNDTAGQDVRDIKRNTGLIPATL